MRAVTQSEIDSYQRDGVVCLRGLFEPCWIDTMRSAFDLVKRQRGPFAQCYEDADQAGEFFFDIDIWTRLASFRTFVFDSPAAEIAAQLMRSSRINLFYDQVFIKEPGTVAATPWHQDQPYWQVDGAQVCTLWLPLDPVPRTLGVEFVRGSHLDKTMYSPVSFDESNEPYDTSMPSVPDVAGHPADYDIVGWDVEPGDCLVFQAMILHGAKGGTQVGRRRALATRWCGDDARYVERANKTNIPTSDPGLKPGDEMNCGMFPQVFPRAE